MPFTCYWPQTFPVTSSRLSGLSHKMGQEMHAHRHKSAEKKVLCKVMAFLETSRSQRASRDSSLPPSVSFLFHSLAFYAAKTSAEGVLEPLALSMYGILDSSRMQTDGHPNPQPSPYASPPRSVMGHTYIARHCHHS